MSADDVTPAIVPDAAITPDTPVPPGRDVTVTPDENELIGMLLNREVFHLRAATRQTTGRPRKRAVARLEQVQELMRKFGGPYAHR